MADKQEDGASADDIGRAPDREWLPVSREGMRAAEWLSVGDGLTEEEADRIRLGFAATDATTSGNFLPRWDIKPDNPYVPLDPYAGGASTDDLMNAAMHDRLEAVERASAVLAAHRRQRRLLLIEIPVLLLIAACVIALSQAGVFWGNVAACALAGAGVGRSVRLVRAARRDRHL